MSSHQHQIIAMLNNQTANIAVEKMDISEEASMEIALKVNNLVLETLDSLFSEGNQDADTKQQLLLEYSNKYAALVRDYKSIKESQVSKVKQLMDKKMRERRQRQLSRQQSKKAEVCSFTVALICPITTYSVWQMKVSVFLSKF